MCPTEALRSSKLENRKPESKDKVYEVHVELIFEIDQSL